MADEVVGVTTGTRRSPPRPPLPCRRHWSFWKGKKDLPPRMTNADSLVVSVLRCSSSCIPTHAHVTDPFFGHDSERAPLVGGPSLFRYAPSVVTPSFGGGSDGGGDGGWASAVTGAIADRRIYDPHPLAAAVGALRRPPSGSAPAPPPTRRWWGARAAAVPAGAVGNTRAPSQQRRWWP